MTSGRQDNNLLKDMEKLIQQNNLLLLEIQDIKEDQLNSGISVDFLGNRLDRKSERISQLEKTIQGHKEKTIRCESDIRSQKDRIRSQKEKIENQGKIIQNQKERIEKQREIVQNHKEKIIRCESDIIDQRDKIRSQTERIENQGKIIQKQKQQIEKMRKNVLKVKNSYAFLFGQAFVNAIKKPGINTILLPYRWIRLTLRQWL